MCVCRCALHTGEWWSEDVFYVSVLCCHYVCSGDPTQVIRPVWQTLWLMSHLTIQGCEVFKIVINIYNFCHLHHLNTILSNHQPSTPQF